MAKGSHDIAVWGIGGHAQKTVLPAINACSSLRLTGVGSRNSGVCEDQARVYGCWAWTSLDELLSSDDVDIVFLSTPIGLHCEEGLRVLRSGRHLWCEKSLCMSFDQAVMLEQLARDLGLSLCLVCAPLFHTAFHGINDRMDRGEIGTVRSVTATFEFPHLPPGNIRYKKDLGGGALLDIGFYPLVVGDRLLGGQPGAIRAELLSETAYEVDTAGTAEIEYGNGAMLRAQWAFGRDYRNEISVQGTDGEIILKPAYSKPEDHDIRLTVSDGKIFDETVFEPVNQFVLMLDEFCLSLGSPSERDRQRVWALHTQKLIADVRAAAGEQDA